MSLQDLMLKNTTVSLISSRYTLLNAIKSFDDARDQRDHRR